jgi:Ca2+-binding EF-hand superfamily protein
MKLARTALFGAVSLALAAGSAFAADTKKSRFDRLDANNDGVITRAEAVGSPTVLKDFDRADKNNDGKITRAEYRAAFPVKAKATDAKSKPAKSSANDRDPGFNALDRNNDGYITRAEARGNPHLAKNFKAADRNNDGKLNRAEYLAVMTKKDLNTAKAKVDNKLDRAPSASTGASAPPQ